MTGSGLTTYNWQPFQRNPLEVYVSFGLGSVAPHANTTRQTYTVPAARRSKLMAAALNAVRNTAAAPIGAFRINLGISGSFTISCYSLQNTPGIADRVFVGQGAEHIPGTVIILNTADAGTGGTVDYFVNSQYLEWDQ